MKKIPQGAGLGPDGIKYLVRAWWSQERARLKKINDLKKVKMKRQRNYR